MVFKDLKLNIEKLYTDLGVGKDDNEVEVRILLLISALISTQSVRCDLGTRIGRNEVFKEAKSRIFWTLLAEIATQMTENAKPDPAIKILMAAQLSTDNFITSKDWWPLHSAAACKRTTVRDIQTIGQTLKNDHGKGIGEAKVLPYHIAAAVRGPNLDIIRRLRGFSLRSGRAKDSRGNLPLHYAAEFSNSVSMVVGLLQDYPGGVIERNRDLGETCVHCLCRNPSTDSPEMLRVVLAAKQAAAAIQDNYGHLPLHSVLRCRVLGNVSREDMAMQLVKAYPEGCAVGDVTGISPLHNLCRAGLHFAGKLRVMEAMLVAFPTAVTVQDQSGRCCVHYLCGSFVSQAPDMLRLILVVNPAVAAIQDNIGNLPLHFICTKLTREKVSDIEHILFQQLLTAYPEGCAVENTEGQSPFRSFCRINVANKLQTIEFMLSVCPHVINTRDQEGRNVLHYAVKCNNVDVFRRLCSARPGAISERDHSSWTLLHHCAHACKSVEFLREVYNVDPSAITVVNNQGQTVLQLLLADSLYKYLSAEDMKMMLFLLRKYPEAALIPDNDGRTPYSRYKNGFSEDIRRVFLRAAPTVDPSELRHLNYSACRMALFLFFVGVRGDGELTLFSRLSQAPRGEHIVRTVVSFL